MPTHGSGELVDRDVVALLLVGHVCARGEDIAGAVSAHSPATLVIEALQVAHLVLQGREGCCRLVERQWACIPAGPPTPTQGDDR